MPSQRFCGELKHPHSCSGRKKTQFVCGTDAHTQQAGELGRQQKGGLILLLKTISPNPLFSSSLLGTSLQLNLPKKQFYSQSELSLRQPLLAEAHVSSEAGKLARICSRPLGLLGRLHVPSRSCFLKDLARPSPAELICLLSSFFPGVSTLAREGGAPGWMFQQGSAALQLCHSCTRGTAGARVLPQLLQSHARGTAGARDGLGAATAAPGAAPAPQKALPGAGGQLRELKEHLKLPSVAAELFRHRAGAGKCKPQQALGANTNRDKPWPQSSSAAALEEAAL